MIGRRGALYRMVALILGGVWALVSCSSSRVRPISPRRSINADPNTAAAQADLRGEQLLQDLSRLDKRVYSEQGIPMFLACENLAEGKGKASSIAPTLASNAAVAAAFRQQVEDLSRVSPDLSEWDVAKLVELLADRDITRGGKEIKP